MGRPGLWLNMRLLVLAAAVAAVLSAPVLVTQDEVEPVTVVKPKKEDPPVVIVREAGTSQPKAVPTTQSEIDKMYPDPLNNPNTYEKGMHPLLPKNELAVRDAIYEYAAPSELDPEMANPDGHPDLPTVKFGYNITGHINPMEKKTPIYDDIPCIASPIQVTIPAAKMIEGLAYKHPFLPPKYGCSKEKELSREKASFEVSWSNYTADVVDFSIQMISMGSDECSMRPEDGFNRIHWHVVGIKPSPTGVTTLTEGASHDTRTLRGGVEQPNNFYEEYYSGPCPVPGTTECFRFKVLGHLSDGKTCMCGYKDFLYERPFDFVHNNVPQDGIVPDLNQAILPPPEEESPKRKINFVDMSDEQIEHEDASKKAKILMQETAQKAAALKDEVKAAKMAYEQKKQELAIVETELSGKREEEVSEKKMKQAKAYTAAFEERRAKQKEIQEAANKAKARVDAEAQEAIAKLEKEEKKER